MTCTAKRKSVNNISATNILPQTPFWAKVKYQQGFVPQGFELTVSKELLNPYTESGKLVHEDLLILIKYVNEKDCFAYVPYGPKLEPKFEQQGMFLEKLSEALKPHLPANCVFIRYDLIWENQWAEDESYYDDKGNWQGPPSAQTQEFRVNFGTDYWNLKKSPGDALPKNTFFLDLEKKDEELLYEMRYNTRYNIRQAFKKGVAVKEYGVEMLDEWFLLYEETALRKGIEYQSKDYFLDLFANQDEQVRVCLLMATYEEQVLASMFLVLSNKRATYLFGASSSHQKQVMGSYALQWEAIRRGKEFGCEEYDLFGCAPNLDKSHPLHGVHLYKKGFGGEIYHRMGCWDYPFDQGSYELMKALELNK
ncbi:peptidoglycan bridge formation glycyltransferase FemA/FemB family protein [Echinicola marina]|uniref:lipid II:glycine glycyltransferase FemX n=1 Tax=Echinicola marina TaxID=2859768 RepID=UPI001CF7032E|nr:peptidoglycan bridge formation glycyltransferase FemA/FemB family protein [Echinicola marina]UCS93744.1 peptidoglycan bridge formation glycyltransferase FemA/FemB family protein [Echinicola marina]